MNRDADRGAAYTDRIVTLGALFLAVVTTLLVLVAPWLMSLYLNSCFQGAGLSEQRESVVAFARYCLPQVFFYGMFVLVGQLLNARGRFGPMMWAPIANNLIAIGVLLAYLLVHGTATSAEQYAGYTSSQELLLGLGSTAGIAVQFLILLPYLRRAGVSYHPRFDFRGTGLAHTLRLGVWTVLFVVVNQIAYTVVVRLASGGTSCAGALGDDRGTGYTVYSTAFLIAMVPHSVVTVSLATAVLPTLAARAAQGDLAGLAGHLAGVLRSALVVIVPFAFLMPVVARDVANTISFGAVRDHYDLFVLSLALFGPAIALFTVHYLVLRGFYALERTRTVFWVQCAVAATNIAVAVVLVARVDPEHTSPALVTAYASSYAVGSAISYLLLRRLLGGLQTRALAGFLARLLLASAIATAVGFAVLHLLAPLGNAHGAAALRLALVLLADVVTLVALAGPLKLREVVDILTTITTRLRQSQQS